MMTRKSKKSPYTSEQQDLIRMLDALDKWVKENYTDDNTVQRHPYSMVEYTPLKRFYENYGYQLSYLETYEQKAKTKASLVLNIQTKSIRYKLHRMN